VSKNLISSILLCFLVHIYDATSGRIWGQCDLREHLSFPTSVCVNDRHELYISDNESHFVRVFDYNGQHLKNIGAGISYPIACRIVSLILFVELFISFFFVKESTTT
jgi:hypothetical protein